MRPTLLATVVVIPLLTVTPTASAGTAPTSADNCEISALPAPVFRPGKVQTAGGATAKGSLRRVKLTWSAPKAKAEDVVRYRLDRNSASATETLSDMVCPTATTWIDREVALGVDVTYALTTLGHRDADVSGNPPEASKPAEVTVRGSKVRLRTKRLGRKTRFRGTAVTSAGAVAGATVVLKLRRDGRWKTFAKATTDANGHFDVRRSRKRARVQAIFRGGEAMTGNRSPVRRG